MDSQISLKVIFYRIMILLNVVQQIRTLESESAESLDHYRRHNVHNRRNSEFSPYPSFSPHFQSQGEEEDPSSVENSVKHHQNKQHHSNAIVRATNRHQNNHHSQFHFARSDASGKPTEQINHSSLEPTPLPDEILRQMRIEMVKQQILKKLRLKEAPKSPKLPKDLPIPVTLGETLIKNNHQPSVDKDVEDFYGKTEQIIVFPDDSLLSQCTTSGAPSSCFLFKLPKEILYEEIESVEMWVYKLPDPNDISLGNQYLRNQSFFIRSVKEEDDSEEYDEPLTLDPTLAKTNVKQIQGWFSMTLTTTAVHWLQTANYYQTLQIGCTTCARFRGSEDLGSPIGFEGEERPFIVFNMASVVKKKRSRRYINCTPGVTECCRERFVVDFKAIGWNWIIGPDSYEAYYCKGSCIGSNSLSNSGSIRTSIVQRHLSIHETNSIPELVPCCTATRMSSISLIYYDVGDNSTTPIAQTKTLPNMVVESCGCL